jgi:Zn-dependent protease
MAWQDRHYYRDQSGRANSPLTWLIYGSVPLFTALGIRVRALSWMVVYVVSVLLFGLGRGFTWQDRVQNVTVLFAIVLAHEFGHCFTCRWVGGEANDILMHPLGGVALALPPRRPWPTFLTVAGGPAVNVLICLICGLILHLTSGWLPWNPFSFHPIGHFDSWVDIWRYANWIFQISYMLLIFNLLPIYPLDGGQMLQTILWPSMGYYKATLFSCVTGMICAVIAAALGLASGNLSLAILAGLGFFSCYQKRLATLADGPYESEDTTDYSAAYEIEPPRKHSKLSRWTIRRAAKKARKLAIEDRREQAQIDAILAKVSAHGMQSLTWSEKRALKKATEHQRQRDVQIPRGHR